MLSVAQGFADESSFQYSMSKSQVVVFGGPDHDEEFTLMGRPMKQVDEYKYLGLVFHRNLGCANSARRDKKKRLESYYVGKKFLDEVVQEDGRTVTEERMVDYIVEEDSDVDGLRWMGQTSLIGDEDDPELAEKYILEEDSREGHEANDRSVQHKA